MRRATHKRQPPRHWKRIETFDQLTQALLHQAYLARMVPARQAAEALETNPNMITRMAHCGVIPSAQLPAPVRNYTRVILHIDLPAARKFLQKSTEERRQAYREIRNGTGVYHT